MQIAHTSNNIIDIVFDPNTEGLCLLDFVLVEEGRERFLAQVIELADDKYDASLNLAKIQIFYSINSDDEIIDYNGFTPTRTCKITLCNQREIEEFINADKKTFDLSVNPKTMLPLNFNIDFFENNPIILSDKMEDFNILSSNLANVLSEFKNVVIFDYTGSLNLDNSTRLRAGIDFKIPLDYYSLDYIWEDAMDKATLEVQAVSEDIFNEVKEYAKSIKGKLIPYNLFLKVIREQYRQTPIPELWYLRNKLVGYQKKQLFAKDLKDVEILSKALQNDKISVIDFSHVDVSWHKAFCDFILRAIKNDVYLFMRLNDTTINSEFVGKIYQNKKVKVIPSASYGYKKLPNVLEHANNYIFLSTLNPTRNFGPANASIWGLDSNYALLFGDDTKGFIFKIQNTVSLDEAKTRKRGRKIKLKSIHRYTGKIEQKQEEVVEQAKYENAEADKIVVEKETDFNDNFDLASLQEKFGEKTAEEIIKEENSLEVSEEKPSYIEEEVEENIEEDFQNLLEEDEAHVLPEEEILPQNIEEEQVQEEDDPYKLTEEENEILGVMGEDELDFYDVSADSDNEIDYEGIVKRNENAITQEEAENIEIYEENKQENIVEPAQEVVIEPVQEEVVESIQETIAEEEVKEEGSIEDLANQVAENTSLDDRKDIPDISDSDLEIIDNMDFDNLGDLSLDENLDLQISTPDDNNSSQTQNAPLESSNVQQTNEPVSDENLSLEDIARQAQEDAMKSAKEEEEQYDVIDLAPDTSITQSTKIEDLSANSEYDYNSDVFDIMGNELEDNNSPKVLKKSDFKEGEVVKHDRFGIGKVLEIHPYSNRTLLQIEFADIGKRLLDPKIANIKHLSDK